MNSNKIDNHIHSIFEEFKLYNKKNFSKSATKNTDKNEFKIALASKIQSIPDKDPESEKKAFKAYLELYLVLHLGQDLVLNPKFHLMVEKIYSNMVTNQKTAQMIEEAGSLLLKKYSLSAHNKSN